MHLLRHIKHRRFAVGISHPEARDLITQARIKLTQKGRLADPCPTFDDQAVTGPQGIQRLL
jgi:hypothetical protein